MKHVRLAPLTTLSLAALAMAAANPAHAADIVRFNATGVFTDGATLGGSLDIDVVAGSVVKSQLTVSDFGLFDQLSFASNPADGGYEFFAFNRMPSPYAYFSGVFTTLSLVGFKGGDFASLQHPAQGQGYSTTSAYISYIRNTQGLVSGSLTAVPEPASWALMLTGFAGVGIGLRRRTARRIRMTA